MINLSGIRSITTNSLGRTGLLLQKSSPEILLGLGVVGVVASTVLACRATLKVDKITKEAKEKLEKIKYAHEQLSFDQYTDKDYKQDLALTYVKTSGEYLKLYFPAIALGAVSISLIIGSHNILSRRNAALAAAYELIDAGYKRYRERVKNELGNEADQRFRFGDLKDLENDVTITEKDENGKVKTETIHIRNNPSEYARYFDETCPSFQRSYELNSFYLRSKQTQLNDLLHARGHVFLNEVYDELGMDRTQAGQAVGWIKGYHKGDRDGYILFGLESPANQEDPKYDHINEGQPWLLDFNVDGNIWNLI